MSDYRQGFGFDIGFIDYLQVVTTNNHNTIAISTLYNPLELTLSLFQPAVSSLVVVWQWLLTIASPLLPCSSSL
jgi:hypothetical protein